MKALKLLQPLIVGAVLLAIITSGSAATAAPPTERPVLCWYMVCFGNSVEVYKQEIALAQRHRIDGFLLDVGEWQSGSPGNLKPTNYVQSAERMYEAARQLGTGFRLAMAPEYSVQPFPENVQDMVMRFRDHPNQLRHNGKVVLSGYCAGSMFPPAIEKLKAAGVPVCLVPHVFFPRFAYRPSVEMFTQEFAATPCLDGLMMFNPVELGSIISDNASGRRATLKLDKIFAAEVSPAYNSANLQDYRGLSGYLAMWQGAINDGADWISLVIWNDYNEDSNLMPSHWPSGSERNHYDRDESFLDATAYASAWFKVGRPPAITQDKFVITYRNRSKWQRRAWDGQRWVDLSLQTGVRFDQIHDDVEDLVYVDTFLTAPASMTVQLADKTNRFEMPAGVGHAEVPLVPGVPRVILTRANQVLADVVGRKLIIDQPTKQNSLLGTHLANRTWTSGTAVGPVVRRLAAESGKLGPGATVVTQNGVRAVQNSAVKGSGFSVPVQGLATATYNIRIRYSNPSSEEARLTLFADGPPRAANDFPYFIPAFLPPTGKGEFRVVSFLWSLYDTTRTLKLQWEPSLMWGQPMPTDDDHGTVLVEAIELVKVEPFAAAKPQHSAWPEMVWIPGGNFVMGSDKGEPDEKPRHPVTISGFAMGKQIVTNAEFERFDPTHRQFRNGNSWRDREPVLHVSWLDAAKYCNWLSAQVGLTPVYGEQAIDPAKPGEKFWAANFKADGFRLPTEAEWEYVATGRGEARTYPWGEATPIPGLHGWFQGRAALGSRLPRPATEQTGVVVVGSFPTGASRDGVMDMAGNVGQWCTDWYDEYPSNAQADPSQAKPGNYRVIRGGSWSWYGQSQRSTDREFNSPNYPGHAYYGFRVALPEAGWKKMPRQP